MKRGWCPSLAAPMPAADGLLLRFRPRLGRLDGDAARLVAEAAQRHGSGVIELTNRGSLQLRGFSESSARDFTAAIEDAGIAAPAGHDKVMVSPLLGADPHLHPETAALAEAIGAHLAGLPDFAGAGEKFLVAVDGGGAARLGGCRADLAFRAEGRTWHLLIDGARREACCTGDPAAAAIVLIDRLLTDPRGLARMRDLVALMGDEVLFALAGLVPAGAPPPEASAPNGFLDGAGGAFGIGVAFGEMDAATLIRLAGLAARFGDGVLRLAPKRIILLAGIAAADAAALMEAAAPLITDAADPRLGLAACIGAPRCAAATTDTRADALSLAAAGLARIHVSGCAKGCAHPAPARATLVGRDGRYDLVRDGTARDAPARTGLILAEAALHLRGEAA